MNAPSANIGLILAGLCLFLTDAHAGLRYKRVNGNAGFTVGHTKVINLNLTTGFVSPKFDDILVTDFSFRAVPHGSLPLTWSVQVQERRQSYINRIDPPGAMIAPSNFENRTFTVPEFRSIGTTQAKKEFFCGVSFPSNGTRCLGWVHLRLEYTHPIEPPLSILAFAWNDDGAPLIAGQLPVEEIHTEFTTFGPRKLTWLTGINHRYQLQSSKNLSEWLPVGGQITGTGFRQESTLDGDAAPVFFRLHITDQAELP